MMYDFDSKVLDKLYEKLDLKEFKTAISRAFFAGRQSAWDEMELRMEAMKEALKTREKDEGAT